MKTFRDLYLHLNGADINSLVKRFAKKCHPPWYRSTDKENDVELPEMKHFCFERKGETSLPSAVLFLFPKDDDSWYVSNIMPSGISELSYDQYNTILEDFLKAVVQPAIKGTQITAEITSNEISIGSLAGKEVEDALVRFSDLANKSTGNSHPLDRKRWFDFLVLANDSTSELPTDLVIQELVELGWSEERAYELGLQYELANDLLNYLRER